ncbi:MAG: fructose-bisphosphate aldolase [Candidatus Bipolaricaulota bacterium]|nr:fructose-bisphosphate aldolase [Candidatus Bipolaricaulota bacterium]
MSGKEIRLRRIFRTDGRAVVVALDHGQFKHEAKGLDDIEWIIKRVVDGGADAIILNPGPAKQFASVYAGRSALILRLTGASTEHNPNFDYHRQIATVEQAVALGADAVLVMGFIGGSGEAHSLELLAKIAGDCSRYGMPLIAEMLPVEPDRFNNTKWIRCATRVGYELGADCIKAYFTGESAYKAVIESCPVPILIAGGPKVAEPQDMVRQALGLGAAGVAFGRNVFESDNPTGVIERLVSLVHSN